ncbi:LppU/SCO3897 family protein [Kitasatospora sp. NPDC004531]
MSTPQPPQNPQPPVAPEAAGQAPFQYGQAPQVPVAPKKTIGKKLLSGLGILVLVIIIGVVKFVIRDATTEKPVHAKVGQCVAVTGSETDPKVDNVGCDDSKATHTVEKVIDNTFDTHACGDEFDALAQQLGSDKFVLCLTPKK